MGLHGNKYINIQATVEFFMSLLSCQGIHWKKAPNISDPIRNAKEMKGLEEQNFT